MLDEQGTSDPSRNEDNEDNSRSIYSEISMAAPSGQYEYQKARIINFRIKTKTRDVPTHYNVVVCGDYGVGKTSLIQTVRSSILYSAFSSLQSFLSCTKTKGKAKRAPFIKLA